MKMKFSVALLLLVILSSPQNINAQSLAINTDGSTANTSAMLDVKSNFKGLLIPRMTRTERNAIASPATGLLIFQTGPDSVGFHYFEGGKWRWLLSGSNADSVVWRTKGNAGTTDASNFIGTVDDVPFNIKVNNQKSGRITSAGESFLGYQAGNVNTSVFNTGMGYQALASNTTGDNNTAMGREALRFNTTGVDNTAIGFHALTGNTTGINNTATGKRALAFNSTGINNTAVGLQALEQNTTGIQNTAIGMQTLLSNSSGDNNTAIGLLALQANTTGGKNTAVGEHALSFNTTGDYNTALGSEALYSNTGNSNVALGTQSLRNNISGSKNVGIGVGALYSNSNTSNQVAIGDSSLYFSIGNAFLINGNTALGSKAGYNVTTGNRNLFLGYQAGYNVTSGSNQLYIANNSIDPPLIYGNFSNKTLGLGTITPNLTYGYAKVEIASEGYLAPTDLLIRNAVNNAGYAPGLVFQHARGTLATPITVNNGDYLSAISTMNYDGSNYILSAGLDIYADGAIATGIVPTRLQFNTMNTAGSYASRLTIKNNGKVGIGTTVPAAKLHIGGGTRFTVLDTGSIFLQSGNTIGSARDWKIYVPMPQGYLSFRDMGFDNLNNGMSTDAMVIQYGTGNVGIGATVPNSTLHVDGTIAVGTSLNVAGGTSGSPVSLLNQKSYVAVLPANALNSYYQLPDPTLYPGRMYIVRNNSAVNTANITTAAGLLFPGNSNVGVATYALNPTSSPKTVMAISDGANWTIMVQN